MGNKLEQAAVAPEVQVEMLEVLLPQAIGSLEMVAQV
jgi:hypothetical protein